MGSDVGEGAKGCLIICQSASMDEDEGCCGVGSCCTALATSDRVSEACSCNEPCEACKCRTSGGKARRDSQAFCRYAHWTNEQGKL